MCKSVNPPIGTTFFLSRDLPQFYYRLKHTFPMVVWGTVELGFPFSHILSSLGLERTESKCSSTRPVFVVLSPMKQAKISPVKSWSIIWYMACVGHQYEVAKWWREGRDDTRQQRSGDDLFLQLTFRLRLQTVVLEEFPPGPLSSQNVARQRQKGCEQFWWCPSFSVTVCISLPLYANLESLCTSPFKSPIRRSITPSFSVLRAWLRQTGKLADSRWTACIFCSIPTTILLGSTQAGLGPTAACPIRG